MGMVCWLFSLFTCFSVDVVCGVCFHDIVEIHSILYHMRTLVLDFVSYIDRRWDMDLDMDPLPRLDVRLDAVWDCNHRKPGAVVELLHSQRLSCYLSVLLLWDSWKIPIPWLCLTILCVVLIDSVYLYLHYSFSIRLMSTNVKMQSRSIYEPLENLWNRILTLRIVVPVLK
jgi:hypothetical protein